MRIQKIQRKYVLVVIAAVLSAAIVLLSLFPVQDLQRHEYPPGTGMAVSPINKKLSPGEYRFTEWNGNILYGPYQIDDESYFYYWGNVLNEDFEKVENTDVENLHNLYMKTYLDPLFYSPGPKDEFDFSGFMNFSKNQFLTKKCGLHYDVFPDQYLEELEVNKKITDEFFEHPSLENAGKLLDQNRDTLSRYVDGINEFGQALKKNVTENRCFESDQDLKRSNYFFITPERFEITYPLLVNYTKALNDNSRALMEDIRRRREILTGGGIPSLPSTTKPEGLSLSEVSWEGTETAIDKKEAVESTNERRKKEYEIFNLKEEFGADGLKLINKDEVKQFKMKLNCIKNSSLVYGVEKDIYPNIFLATKPRDIEYNSTSLNFFASCRCPYSEETRLDWYMLNDLYEDVSKEKAGNSQQRDTRIGEIEHVFLKYPGTETAEKLSSAYYRELVENIKSDRFDETISVLWSRSQKEKTKIHRFRETFDDFYNKYHMKVWYRYFNNTEDVLGENQNHTHTENDGGEEYTPNKYYAQIIMESQYHLTFMTWSDSVWRLDRKPKMFRNKEPLVM